MQLTGWGKTLNPANRIVLNAQGQQSGQFNAPDLTVNYTYVRTGSTMQLNGNLQFDMGMQGNCDVVQTFQLGPAMAESQGNVLGEQGVTTASDNDVDDTTNFTTSVLVPAQTASMAFTYTGPAYGAGRGDSDPTNFWFYPFTNWVWDCARD